MAPAIGSDLKYYVSKLSRVYTDVGSEAGPVRFIDRAIRIVQQLEERHRPDVVLIDSRAGLHDLAAVSIVGIADYSFLFASGTDATWQGYTALFSHWKAFPEVARAIRERLCVVYALFPETDQTARNQRFIEHSYSLFLETLYDEIEPPTDLNIPEQDRFTFDQHDSTAPHYPWKIKWSGWFQEFSGSMIDQGVLDDLDITGAFGEFLARVRPLAERSQA